MNAYLFASVQALTTELDSAYERGWQPADILHVARRSKDDTDTDLAATLVLHHALRTRAEDRAPLEWVDQLRTVSELHPGAARLARRITVDDPDGRFLGEGLAFNDPYYSVDQLVSLASTWQRLPAWTMLTAPPSRWPAVRVAAVAVADGLGRQSADTKVLNKVRGLLAKAEATEFTEEAETFTAKAQELMTRYAISAALLDAQHGTGETSVRSRRIHLDNPYVKEKVHLLTEIGDANRVRTVWFSDLAIATVVGTPLDLQQVDLLFTSLLVQATRAMQSTAAHGRKGSRTTSYRKAFLSGFSSRIGQRIRDADTKATAEAAAEAAMPVSDLLPILATTSEAVDAEFDRLFPSTRKARARPVDADGWHAGRSAADDASLAPGRQPVTR